MITVETNIPVYGVEPKQIFNPPSNQFAVLDFHKADWPNILLSLQSIDWIATLEPIPPSSCFDYFIDTLKFPIIRSVQQCFHLPYYKYDCP